jgi:hypothetical protein
MNPLHRTRSKLSRYRPAAGKLIVCARVAPRLAVPVRAPPALGAKRTSKVVGGRKRAICTASSAEA